MYLNMFICKYIRIYMYIYVFRRRVILILDGPPYPKCANQLDMLCEMTRQTPCVDAFSFELP